MVDGRPRSERVPNANNPRLLVRLLTLVASGIRKPKALAEVLDVELRTVHYYSQAGEWLGLLTSGDDLHLTDAGLELAMAEPRRRRRLYADAVWRNPLAAAILEGRGQLPETDVIASFLLSRDPAMAEATARRRATAVRGLIAPALGHSPRDTREPEQLQLGFAAPTPRAFPVVLDLRAGREESPDVYAVVLQVLLDNGELSTGNLRAVLDRASEGELPLASYAEMALRRGDARRQDDRLVVTAEACLHAELADDPVLLALTDPAYRQYLALAGGPERPPPQTRQRFRAWDRRIFGEALEPGALGGALSRVLMGRRLEGLPIRGTSAGPLPRAGARPFVESLGREPMIVAFPQTLRQLTTGIARINDQIRLLRQSPASVRLPVLAEPRTQVHSGLFHPGEPLPSAIPDTFSLRLRAIVHTPALALLTALLLLDRHPEVPLAVQRSGDAVRIRWEVGSPGTELEFAL